MSNRFNYTHSKRMNDLSPKRAACLRYAKTFSKVEQQFDNRVFFQFDEDGVILRASDKDILHKAIQKFEYMNEMNKIELVGWGISAEDYKKIINQDLKKVLNKNDRCFILLISYDSFRYICDQLARYGFKKPLKFYEETMETHNRFCILLCNAGKFEQVKEDLEDIFRNYYKKDQQNSSVSNSKEQSVENSNYNDNQQKSKDLEIYSQSGSSKDISQINDINTFKKTDRSRLFNLFNQKNLDDDEIMDGDYSGYLNNNNSTNNNNNNNQNENFAQNINTNNILQDYEITYQPEQIVDNQQEDEFLKQQIQQQSLQIKKQQKQFLKIHCKVLLWMKSKAKLIDNDLILKIQQENFQVEIQFPEVSALRDFFKNDEIQMKNVNKNRNLITSVSQIEKNEQWKNLLSQYNQNINSSITNEPPQKNSHVINKNDLIDLIDYENFRDLAYRQDISDLRKQSMDYFFQKFNKYKNFCFLIAPKSIFEEVYANLEKIQASIQESKKQNKQQLNNNEEQKDSNLTYFNIKEFQNWEQKSANCYLVQYLNVPFFVKKYTENLEQVKQNCMLIKNYSIPKMIRFYGFAQQENILHCVFDYKQFNLKNQIENGLIFTEKQKFEISMQIVASLQFLHKHRKPIPHGNMIPSNILLDEANNIYLADLSVIVTTKSSDYLAPELKPDQKPTIEGDLYALGKILLEIFTGRINEYKDKSFFSNLKYPSHLKIIFDMIQQLLGENQNSRPSCDNILDEIEYVYKQAGSNKF